MTQEEKYKYYWDNDKSKVYGDEREVKEDHPKACEPDTHKYQSTFVFGLYRCPNCKVYRERA